MSSSLLQRLPRQLSPLVVGAIVISASFAWYYLGNVSAEAQVGAPPAAAPTVEVLELQPVEIRTWHEFSGRLAPVESAAIKPLVGGTIQQVLFTDGQLVEQGSPLFVIDPRPHEAAVQRAEAQLATARSRARLAKDEHHRAAQLLETRALSQSLYDTAQSNLQIAQAAVQEAASALQQATLNLEYAHISAPISGRVSRAELTVGNVVEAGPNAPVLATIVANDRFYAEFSVNEQLYIQSVRSTQEQQSMPVELRLAEDAGVVYQGHIHAFDNTDGALTAGMYANLRVGSADPVSALLVPERAIGTNQSRKFVYVVGADKVAHYREVELGGQHEGHRIVMMGLAAGDQVVVNGLFRVAPEAAVEPVLVAAEIR